MAGLKDGVLPHINAEEVEEERRVAYVGMTRARRRLGLTYAGERYGDRSRPSPFLFEIVGGEKRCCIWTGPRLEGANDRLPLPSPDEMRRHASRSDSAAAPEPSNHHRTKGAKPGQTRKRTNPKRGRFAGEAE